MKRALHLLKINELWLDYKKNEGGIVGMVVLIFFTLCAILAPIIARYSPLQLTSADAFTPPCIEFPMGTDDLSRDVLSYVIWAARTSLTIGFISTALGCIIGTLAGSLAGYYGGLLDHIFVTLTDAFLVIPVFLLAIVVVALFGSSFLNIILTIALLSWPGVARIVRSRFLSLRETGFVEAAKCIGASNVNIIFFEILPNVLPEIIVNASLGVSNAIMIESGLAFLGLGDPNVPSWGWFLNCANRYLRIAWWIAFFPGISLFLVCLALNLVGDALNDALNPKLKGV